jgi:hypothetical protein
MSRTPPPPSPADPALSPGSAGAGPPEFAVSASIGPVPAISVTRQQAG